MLHCQAWAADSVLFILLFIIGVLALTVHFNSAYLSMTAARSISGHHSYSVILSVFLGFPFPLLMESNLRVRVASGLLPRYQILADLAEVWNARRLQQSISRMTRPCECKNRRIYLDLGVWYVTRKWKMLWFGTQPSSFASKPVLDWAPCHNKSSVNGVRRKYDLQQKFKNGLDISQAAPKIQYARNTSSMQ